MYSAAHIKPPLDLQTARKSHQAAGSAIFVSLYIPKVGLQLRYETKLSPQCHSSNMSTVEVIHGLESPG